MKPILKLLFVALLIGWALSRPAPVVAQSGGYWASCDSGMSACTTAATQWMSNCVNNDCPHQGSSGQWCFNMAILQGGEWNEFPVCSDSPGYNCIQTYCVPPMNQMESNCLQTHCTWVSD